MNQEVLVSLFRQGLAMLGIALAAKGYVSESDWTMLSGAVLSIGTTAYMVYARWGTVKVKE